MRPMLLRPLTLQADIEKWPFVAPFRIAGYVWNFSEVLVVRLESGGHTGLGEAGGVFYRNDTPASMLLQIEALRGKIEVGLSQEVVQELLPPGGARNALDCALWDLEAKVTGR